MLVTGIESIFLKTLPSSFSLSPGYNCISLRLKIIFNSSFKDNCKTLLNSCKIFSCKSTNFIEISKSPTSLFRIQFELIQKEVS